MREMWSFTRHRVYIFKRKENDGCQEVAGTTKEAIPPGSCDINPIENVFNLVKRELQRQAIKNNITYETYEQFAERVKCTLYAMSSDTIDNIISSMNKRLRLIIGNNGKRTNY